MPESREARQDRAIVLLLESLPTARLERILTELGVPPEKAAERKPDTRRCSICSNGYVRCRAIWENDHEWTPDKPPPAPRPPELAPERDPAGSTDSTVDRAAAPSPSGHQAGPVKDRFRQGHTFPEQREPGE